MRRTDSRHNVRIELNSTLLVTKICFTSDRLVKLNKKLLVNVINISESGILICSNLNLPLNLKLFLNFTINNGLITCIADIIRKENKEDTYHYGCKLFFISEIEKVKLQKFIFSKQKELMRSRSLLISQNSI